MNDNAKKWVAALRSGSYPQGRMALRTPDGYCCLGVACEVARDNGVSLELSAGLEGELLYDGQPSFLPDKVRDWLGLQDRDGYYVGGSLTYMNDIDGDSFDRIADFIESEPKGLFTDER